MAEETTEQPIAQDVQGAKHAKDAKDAHGDTDTQDTQDVQGGKDAKAAKDATDVRRHRLRVGAVIGCVAIALVVVYLLGVNRFSDHFLPKTSINGLDVSGLSLDEARQALENQTSGYVCEVTSDDFALSVPSASVGLERDEEGIARQAKAMQNPYAWPVALIAASNLAVAQNATFDEAALTSQALTAADTYNEGKLPTDTATITLDEETGQYVLGGTVAGMALDKDVVRDAALDNMRSLGPARAIPAEVAFHPATVQDLPRYANSVEWANRSRAADVPILVGGEQVATAESSQISEWVTIGEGPSVAVDEDAIYAWADEQVIYDVYHRDDWTNYYLDEDAFVEQLAGRLATGVVDGFEAPTYEERRREGISRDLAYERGGWDSEMGRYIDVDLEAQFARLFDEKGEVIWESAFVSGSMYEGRPTVTGVFSIYAKQTNTVLVGFDYNNDGKPDYESYVNYWMPFYGGFGLHDATWRANFGGDLYYYNGSHGCVNLPYDKAEELYEITYVGEQVYVHW